MRVSFLLFLATLAYTALATALDRRQQLPGGVILHVGTCLPTDLGALSIVLFGPRLCVQACLAAAAALGYQTTFDGALFDCTPPPPNPSARARRAHLQQRQLNVDLDPCPSGQTACNLALGLSLPTSTSPTSTVGFECVDLASELENCGACGTDCTTAQGVADVMCQNGTCRAITCRPGFRLDPDDRASCVVRRGPPPSPVHPPSLVS